MIEYVDILGRLASNGWTTYRLQNEHMIGNGTICQIRAGRPISTTTIDTVCRLCRCQPGELLRWVPDDEAGE